VADVFLDYVPPAGAATTQFSTKKLGTNAGKDVIAERTFPTSGDTVTGKSLTVPTGAAGQLPAFACFAVMLLADPGNTDPVWVGGADVAVDDGLALYPGVAVTLPVSNTNLLYAIAGVTGMTLHRMAFA